MGSCYIGVEENVCEYRMTVAKFEDRIKSVEYVTNNSIDQYFPELKSLEFSTGDKNKITWCVSISMKDTTPLGYTEKIHKKYTIYFDLKCSKTDNHNIRSKQTLYFLNLEGDKIKIQSNGFKKLCSKSYDDEKVIVHRFSYLKEELLKEKQYLPRGDLTIVFEIHVHVDYTIDSFFNDKSLNNRAVIGNFAKYLKNKELSDITIKVDNKNFPAHRLILNTQSSVFAAMTTYDMREKTTGIIEINDIDSRIVEKMLEFVYTYNVDNFNEVAIDLLYAADKYQLDDLKTMCEKYIYDNLRIDNAAQSFILANCHCSQKMIEYINNFINVHFKEIERTPGYKIMEKDYPPYITMLCRRFVAKIQKIK